MPGARAAVALLALAVLAAARDVAVLSARGEVGENLSPRKITSNHRKSDKAVKKDRARHMIKHGVDVDNSLPSDFDSLKDQAAKLKVQAKKKIGKAVEKSGKAIKKKGKKRDKAMQQGQELNAKGLERTAKANEKLQKAHFGTSHHYYDKISTHHDEVKNYPGKVVVHPLHAGRRRGHEAMERLGQDLGPPMGVNPPNEGPNSNAPTAVTGSTGPPPETTGATPENHGGSKVQKQPKPCVQSQWGAWSKCTTTCGPGKTTRTRKLIKKEVYHGACPPLEETQACTGMNVNANLPCPVDCKLGKWGPWSLCSSSCSGGQKLRKRNMLTAPNDQGKGCEALTEYKACNHKVTCDHNAMHRINSVRAPGE